MGLSPGPDLKVRESLSALLELERARDRRFWKVIGFVVSCATVISAVFSVLAYVRGQQANYHRNHPELAAMIPESDAAWVVQPSLRKVGPLLAWQGVG